MKRLIAVLLLSAMCMAATACCECNKKAGETWGPGLMHWSDSSKATAMPAGAPATAPMTMPTK